MAMQFDVLQHEFVPRTEILDDEDLEEVLQEYDIRKEQLPKQLDTDPATIAVGARPGNVVKITRESQTAGRSIAYRVVVESS